MRLYLSHLVGDGVSLDIESVLGKDGIGLRLKKKKDVTIFVGGFVGGCFILI